MASVTEQQDLTMRVLDELGVLVRHLTRVSGAVEDDRPRTATQKLALMEIATAGPLRLNDLAARMATTPPTASRAVDALTESGLVARVVDPVDRRAVRLELTEAGKALVRSRTERVRAAFEPALTAALSAGEGEQLVVLLARLATALRERSDPRRSA
jgi:DNA-binding MarR family transcriptional regulator